MDAKADPVSNVAGRLLILPGVGNTRFQFSRFAAHAARLLPGFAVEIRTWGQPLLTLRNLRAYTRNLAVARDLAVELARWRHAHPTSKLYLLGYSGGGGVAALVASGLAPEIAIDRLILVAPAISPEQARHPGGVGHAYFRHDRPAIYRERRRRRLSLDEPQAARAPLVA